MLSFCPLYVGFALYKRKSRSFPSEALLCSVFLVGDPREFQSLVCLDSLFRLHRGMEGGREGVPPAPAKHVTVGD